MKTIPLIQDTISDHTVPDSRSDGLVQPDDPEVPLWRYMDISKLMSMLQESMLPFVRLDKLGDDFEGSLPIANEAIRKPQVQKHPMLGEIHATNALFRQAWRYVTYASCWHKNHHEAALLWQVYGSQNGSVAIKTTYQKLYESLPHQAWMGEVQYIDYDSQTVDEYYSKALVFHKRKFFAHEEEVRAVLVDSMCVFESGHIEEKLDNGNTRSLLDTRNWPHNPVVYGLPIDLKNVIDGIYVSPLSPEWVVQVIRNLVELYDISSDIVTQSSMNSTPYY